MNFIESSKRQSNFELLRIVSMFMIVASHFEWQGLQLNINDCLFSEYLIHSFFTSAGRIGANIFLFIGAYFLVDKKFNASRILIIYGKMWFYSVFITLICILVFKSDISLKLIIYSFIPFYSNQWWFPNIYICLLLVTPFLNILINQTKEQFHLLLIILFLLFTIRASIHGFTDTFTDAFTWFVFSYLFFGYYKKYIHLNNKTRLIFLFLSITLYIFLIIVKRFDIFGGAGLATQYLVDYKSLPSFFISFSIFIIFEIFDIKNNFINLISAACFGVYLIHQHPIFYPYLWKRTISTNIVSKMLSYYYGINLYCVIYLFILFLLLAIFDLIIQKTIEYIWKKSRVFNFINYKINNLYSVLY